MDGVRFTGDPKEVARLSQIDTNDSAVRVAWDAVLVLADYAKGDLDTAALAAYRLAIDQVGRAVAERQRALAED